MARRAGKAANRKARQRSVQRSASRPAAPPAPPVATPEVREAVSPDAPRRPPAAPSAAVGSTLTLRERAEYHYVERDLRNIGILTLAMAVLLLVAYIAFSALNLTG